MNNQSNQFKSVRKMLHMNQTEFAQVLGLTQQTISAYETDSAPIPDRLIRTICMMYDISEEWFRTGEGEMHPPKTTDEELAERFGDILADGTDESKRSAVKSILELLDRIPPEYYQDIAEFIDKLNRKH